MRTAAVRMRATVALLALAPACAGARAHPALPGGDPQRVVDELLAADRAFAAAAAAEDGVAAMASMFADDVWMPTSRGDFARGASQAVDALRAALGPGAARLEWAPIRGGVSADAQHGFTLGYVTVHRGDTASTVGKYLSYWVKEPTGWRVAAYKLGRRPSGDVSLAMMAPSLPERLIRPTSDAESVARHTQGLIAAERSFSDRAQRIGLGPAFVEYGRADAVNMGGRDNATFVVGNVAIGEVVSVGSPRHASPVAWSADRARVASSGDLGVTFGFIRQNRPPSGGDATKGIPFFTIWRRHRTADPWRYVAE